MWLPETGSISLPQDPRWEPSDCQVHGRSVEKEKYSCFLMKRDPGLPILFPFYSRISMFQLPSSVPVFSAQGGTF